MAWPAATHGLAAQLGCAGSGGGEEQPMTSPYATGAGEPRSTAQPEPMYAAARYRSTPGVEQAVGARVRWWMGDGRAAAGRVATRLEAERARLGGQLSDADEHALALSLVAAEIEQ